MLGSELRAARLRAAISQEELAVRAGLSREYISQLEGGKKSPTFDVLLRLCWAMDVRAADLVAQVEAKIKRSIRPAHPGNRKV